MGFVRKMPQRLPARCVTDQKIAARDDRYEVNLPVVPAGTPSACAEAYLNELSRFGLRPLEFGSIAPDRMHDDGKFAGDSD